MWPFSSSSEKPAAPSSARNESNPPSQSQSTTDHLKKAAADLDPKNIPEKQKLSPKLQGLLDKSEKEENLFDELVEG